MHAPEILTFLTLYNNIPHGAKLIFDEFLDELKQSDNIKKDTTTLTLNLYQHILNLDLSPQDKLTLLLNLSNGISIRRNRN